VIVPNVKEFRHYMSTYIEDQSGRDLYQRVSRQTLVDISESVERHIGKAKRRKVDADVERQKDS